MPLESFKARRIASAREELRMARTALETLKQSVSDASYGLALPLSLDTIRAA